MAAPAQPSLGLFRLQLTPTFGNDLDLASDFIRAVVVRDDDKLFLGHQISSKSAPDSSNRLACRPGDRIARVGMNIPLDRRLRLPWSASVGLETFKNLEPVNLRRLRCRASIS
jgi:hypothetical protein